MRIQLLIRWGLRRLGKFSLAVQHLSVNVEDRQTRDEAANALLFLFTGPLPLDTLDMNITLRQVDRNAVPESAGEPAEIELEEPLPPTVNIALNLDVPGTWMCERRAERLSFILDGFLGLFKALIHNHVCLAPSLFHTAAQPYYISCFRRPSPASNSESSINCICFVERRDCKETTRSDSSR